MDDPTYCEDIITASSEAERVLQTLRSRHEATFGEFITLNRPMVLLMLAWCTEMQSEVEQLLLDFRSLIRATIASLTLSNPNLSSQVLLILLKTPGSTGCSVVRHNSPFEVSNVQLTAAHKFSDGEGDDDSSDEALTQAFAAPSALNLTIFTYTNTHILKGRLRAHAASSTQGHVGSASTGKFATSFK